MNQRERFHRFIKFQDVKDMPLWGDWLGPYEKWVQQGLPPMPEGETDTRKYLMEYFGFEGIYSAFWGTGRLPVSVGASDFKFEILEKNEQYLIYRNSEGVTVKEMSRHGSATTQQYLDHPLHGSADWPEFCEKHLDPYSPHRYPSDAEWAKTVESCKDRDFIVTVDAGSFYGFLRNWMGVEGISFALFDEPEWVRSAADYLADFYIAVLSRALKDVPDIDAALFWEDMCYKTGPLCSPAMFRECFLPAYKKLTGFLKDNGVASVWVDCDGNIDLLIDLWLEGGVNGFYPLEAAAGMDPLKVKQKYGNKVLLWGGVDKREIAKGRENIDRELMRIKQATEMGGYIPLFDHGVQDDVSLENYRYYDKKRREMFNLKTIKSIKK